MTDKTIQNTVAGSPAVAVARDYNVEDLAGATMPGARLNNILQAIAAGRPLSLASEQSLSAAGLASLLAFAKGNISVVEFKQSALIEQRERLAAKRVQETVLAQKRETERAAADARQKAMWAEAEAERVRRESDPKFIARQKNQELRHKFGIDGFVEEQHFRHLMPILRKLADSSRLAEPDWAWLTAEGREYRSWEVLHAYHRIEADFYLSNFGQTNDPWNAVNASAHLRKCAASSEADTLLKAIPEQRLKQVKLKSAVRTTHGGVMRDLQRLEDALKCGEEAHSLRPEDYRPCTLLGAINIELGNIDAGHAWFRKAEDRGAPPANEESELRSILARMSPAQRSQVVSELLGIDQTRYQWLLA